MSLYLTTYLLTYISSSSSSSSREGLIYIYNNKHKSL